MATTVKEVRQLMRSEADESRALFFQSFFQSEKGGYGEGDRFLGLQVPTVRRIAKELKDWPPTKVSTFLKSDFHEERLLALIALSQRYEKDRESREEIYHIYLSHLAHVNQWDLVDTSAPHILGSYLYESQSDDLLYELSSSTHWWERRIAIIATFYHIRKNSFKTSLKLTEKLLHDEHPLIHKACGWMLREVGKRDHAILHRFLDRFAAVMPRTMLRYALEKCTPQERMKYLKRKAPT